MPFRKDASSTTNSTKTPKQTNKLKKPSPSTSTSASTSRFRPSRKSNLKPRGKQSNNDTASVSSASVMMQFLGLDKDRSQQIQPFSSNSNSSSQTCTTAKKSSSTSSSLKIANSRTRLSYPKKQPWGRRNYHSTTPSNDYLSFPSFLWKPKQRIIWMIIMMMIIMSFLFVLGISPNHKELYYHQNENEYEKEHEHVFEYDEAQESVATSTKDVSHGIRGGKVQVREDVMDDTDGIPTSLEQQDISLQTRSELDSEQEPMFDTKKQIDQYTLKPPSYKMSESLLPKQEENYDLEMNRNTNYHEDDTKKAPQYDMTSSLIDNLMKDDDDDDDQHHEIPTKLTDDILDQDSSSIQPPTKNFKKELHETIHPQESIQNQPDSTARTPPKKIAYVLPVYECPNLKPRDFTAPINPEDPPTKSEKLQDTAFLDAAAILKYTIHRNSIHNPQSSHPSKHSYQMVALVHPSVQHCFDVDGYSRVDALRLLGYDVRIQEIPVGLEEMENREYRHQLELAMETGEKDLIRLHAFGLVEFELVVLVDLRTLIVDSLEDLMEVVLLSQKRVIHDDDDNNNKNGEEEDDNKRKQDLEAAIERVEWVNGSKPNPATLGPISAIYTRDYSSVSPGKFNVGIYPGMVILKPSMSIYNEFVDILKKGDYRRDSGWGGSGIGGFWGDMTTRGILSYYYDILHPQHGLEVNRCRYNNMASNPFIRMNGSTVCRNQKEEAPLCQDCRDRSMESNTSDIITVINVSACRDPWSCYHHSENLEVLRLCREMHSFWFKARRELEGAWKEHGGGGEFGYVPAELVKKEDRARPEHFLGYCSGSGKDQYVAMTPPGKEVLKKGPALDTNAILNQFATGRDPNDGTNQIKKPKKHFDPMKVMFQFAQKSL